MAIVQAGDPVLRQRSREVVAFDDDLKELGKRLIVEMMEAEGAGLAAPQIGVSLRVFAYMTEQGLARVVVNPVLHETSFEEVADMEGCLSLPGLQRPLMRSAYVVFEGYDLAGNYGLHEEAGYRARCIQHEVDHLNGILFADLLPRRERRLFERKFKGYVA